MTQGNPTEPVGPPGHRDSAESGASASDLQHSNPSDSNPRERRLLGRVMPRSLLGRQLLVIGAILGIGNALLLRNFQDYAEQDVVASEQRRIQDLARLVAARLDAGQHEAATVAAPGRDAFVDWARAPAEAQVQHEVLAEFAQTAELDTSTYTLRIKDDFAEAISAEPGRPHHDALEFVLTSATTPYWRHDHTYRPAMASAFLEGEVAVTGRYVDKQGEWVTAYAPLKNSAGDVVAVVGVDAPLAVLFAPLVDRQWRDGRLLSLTFLATFFAVVLIVRQLGAGLRGLEEAAARLGRGDYATPVRGFGFAEVVRLARGLEGARRQVVADMARLEDLRRTLGRRLAEASEQVDAVGRRRRSLYSELVEELQVTVEVGDRPVTAQLIDLTYESLVVGVRKEVAPQLASGMVARVALGTRGEPSRFVFECSNHSRFEIDEMVHLGFKVQGGLRLEEVPKSVGKVLNERRALRISPNSDTELRVAVRRSENVRPVAAEVVDISSDGIKVILPTGHRRFSTWGVFLEVAIRFHPESPALRLAGRVRNCHPTADGRVAVGIEFAPDETPTFEKRQQEVARWVMVEDRHQREGRERHGG